MASNTAPIYGKTPKVSGVAVTAANTKSDGAGTIGTDLFVAFTAGADGAWVSEARFTPCASVAATATAGTVGRLFLSSKTSGATTAGTDTWQIAEVPLVAQTADQTTTAITPNVIPINKAIPANYTILASTHAAPNANTSQQATVYGADY
jgi:hypothetical protein